MKFEQANINLMLSPDVLNLLQMAVSHLGASIQEGSFDIGDQLNKEDMLENLHGLCIQMEEPLSRF